MRGGARHGAARHGMAGLGAAWQGVGPMAIFQTRGEI